MRGLLTIVFVFFLTALGSVRADDADGPAEVWNRFVTALRRGDYVSAHGLFSAESRRAMPYREFVEEYGPLSPARELVLARTESGSTRMEGNWAELQFDGVLSVTGRKFRIGVALVKNDDRWGLVAARNENTERLEAAVRRAMERAAALADSEVMARIQELAVSEPALLHYRLSMEGGDLIAEPLREGLRVFHVGRDGVARSGRHASLLRERESEPELPPTAPRLPLLTVNGYLPELPEPSSPSLPSSLPGELAEPSLPPLRSGMTLSRDESVRGAPMISLPDMIE